MSESASKQVVVELRGVDRTNRKREYYVESEDDVEFATGNFRIRTVDGDLVIYTGSHVQSVTIEDAPEEDTLGEDAPGEPFNF